MTNGNAPVTSATKRKAQQEPRIEAVEFPARAIQEAVLGLSQAMKELNTSRLTENAVIVLLADSTKVSKSTIKEVLRGLKTLEETYIKPVREKRR